jgi:protein-tyrosine phosphatase
MTERVLPLQGGRNFRDIGGYPTEDGRTVRWGKLYRSGSLHGLTAADYAHLAGLNIAVVCDFRSSRERDAEPIEWPGANPPVIHARDYEMSSRHVRGALRDPNRTPETIRQAMFGFYADLPYDHSECYARMFGELLAGRTPLVFNCSAGKDRTGVAAALIFSALGVPREHILHDYSLSEQLVDYHALATGDGVSESATGFSALAKVPREVRAPLLRSDPDYLAVALDEIERREGSVAGYLKSQVGVGREETEVLRGLLLQGV